MSDKAELLSQLRDIRTPIPPEAPALWPVLVAVVLLVVSIITLLLYYRKRRRRWAIEAQHSIRALARQKPDLAIQGYANILKRVVLTLEPDSSVRTVHGSEWLTCLDQVFNTKFFSHDQGQIFGSDLYARSTISNEERDALAIQLCRLIRKKGAGV